MDITLKKPIADNPRNVLRRAGYAEDVDPRYHTVSYTIRLGSGRYPRFHCYIQETETTVRFSLHLDQKQASYEGADHAHSGEYDGRLVEEELGRIRRWAGAPSGSNSSAPQSAQKAPTATAHQETGPTLPTSPPKPTKRKGFFSKLFGASDLDEE